MMKSRHILTAILALCFGFIVFALYLQHYQDVQPCPLCVLQRYAFVVIGLFCLPGVLTRFVRISAIFGFLTALTGAGMAAYQLWIIAHPTIVCGRDPLEEAINQFILAKWLPAVFKSEAYCGDKLAPILGLTPPQWTLVWFVVFAVVLLWIAFRRRR